MNDFENPNAFFEKINQWFNGLIAFPLLAISYAYLEIFSGKFDGLVSIDLYADLTIIFLVVVVVVIITARYRKQIGYIPIEMGIKERVSVYFSFSKKYYLLMFILGMTTTVFIFVFGSTSFAGLYAFQLFVLSLHRPSLLSVANKLNLKGEERSNFLKKNIFEN